jgi:hypothetical protein
MKFEIVAKKVEVIFNGFQKILNEFQRLRCYIFKNDNSPLAHSKTN